MNPSIDVNLMKTSPAPVSDLTGTCVKLDQEGDAGFTLVDLLTTLAVILLLALFLTPALARTRVHDRAYVCLNNMRQLGLAWRMYAEENGDHVTPNTSGSGPTAGWVNGWLDWNTGNGDNTNILKLLNAKLGPYSKSASIYKCPADIYLCVEGRAMLPRVRSVSMNAYVGVANSAGVPSASPTPGWYSYQKLSDIIHPSPANLWVFTEEHADSINDGWLVNGEPGGGGWGDLPASYHDGACSIGFADQHAEMHKWQDAGTLPPVVQSNNRTWNKVAPNDTTWFITKHTSAPIQ
jgi:type II secretory pathway pseudopilin PulG